MQDPPGSEGPERIGPDGDEPQPNEIGPDGDEPQPDEPQPDEIEPDEIEPDEIERAEALAEIHAETLPHEVPRTSPAKVIVRLGFSLAFLALLIWRLPDVELGDIVPEPTPAAFAWVALAIGIHDVAYLLQTLRWAEVSDTLGIHLPFRRLFSHLLTGEFVSNALPTSFGGDIVRVVRQGNDAGDYADAFAATALERLTGWVVLPLLSAAGLLADPDYRSLGGPTLVVVLVGAVTLAALGSLVWVAGHERGAGRLVGREGWRRYLGAVHLGIVAFRHKPGQVTRVLVAGVGFQLLQCVSVWACARAIGMPEVGFAAVLTFFPPAAILQNFPLAMGGLGVREAAFVYFFGAIGATNADAIALGLLVYIVFVLASLAGAPSFLTGGFAGKSVHQQAT